MIAFSFLSMYRDKPVITGDFSFPSISLPGDVSGRFFYSDGYFTQPEEIDRLTEALRTISREDLKDIDLDALRGLC